MDRRSVDRAWSGKVIYPKSGTGFVAGRAGVSSRPHVSTRVRCRRLLLTFLIGDQLLLRLVLHV
jgi:hypothetical protein